MYPCDDLAGRLQRRPGAVCRQARWRCATARKAGRLPCGPSHRRESATLHSSETSRPSRLVFPIGEREMPPSHFALERAYRHLTAGLRQHGQIALPKGNLRHRAPNGARWWHIGFSSQDRRGGALLRASPALRFPEAESCSRYLRDRKSTRLNSSHVAISYAVFCLKKKNIRI